MISHQISPPPPPLGVPELCDKAAAAAAAGGARQGRPALSAAGQWAVTVGLSERERREVSSERGAVRPMLSLPASREPRGTARTAWRQRRVSPCRARGTTTNNYQTQPLSGTTTSVFLSYHHNQSQSVSINDNDSQDPSCILSCVRQVC